MSQNLTSTRRWPRVRLHLRAIVSTTMVIGWIAAALTALLPYLLLERGQGTGGSELLGLSRSGWMSLHVWFSFGMAAFTLAHVLLNRAGVSRGFRVISGRSLDRTRTPGMAGRPVARKGAWTWAAVLATVAGLVVGGLALAPDSTASEGSGGQHERRSETADDLPSSSLGRARDFTLEG